MSANKAPDLAYTWPAASVQAAYARNGKLAPLDDYYKKYDWSWINAFYRGRNSYQGHLYGLPLEQDLGGVYYNKEIFKKVGVEIPKTYAEFTAAADKLKKAGYIPIAFGNRDRWPATNTFSIILGLSAGRAGEEDVLFRDAPWTRPDFKLAAETFQAWAKAGYFPTGFNGIGYDEANALFTSGRAAMNVTGTWVVQDLGREAKFDLGVFMLPPIGKDIRPGTLWGEGSQWQIAASATPEVRDGAAAYLNCLVGPDKRKTWIEKGYLVPIGSSVEEIQSADTLPVVKEFYAKGLATTADNFYDLHTTVPESVTQVLYAELQKLAGGEATPDGFLQQMQAAWSTAVKNGERWVP